VVAASAACRKDADFEGHVDGSGINQSDRWELTPGRTHSNVRTITNGRRAPWR